MGPDVIRIKYHDLHDYKFQLLESYEVQVNVRPVGKLPIITPYLELHPFGTMFLRSGYCWDGPSGPAIATKNFMRGSLIHDAGYQLIRMGFLPSSTRTKWDQELRRICMEDGMSGVRAGWVYAGVRAGGFASCYQVRKSDTITVLEAP